MGGGVTATRKRITVALSILYLFDGLFSGKPLGYHVNCTWTVDGLEKE